MRSLRPSATVTASGASITSSPASAMLTGSSAGMSGVPSGRHWAKMRRASAAELPASPCAGEGLGQVVRRQDGSVGTVEERRQADSIERETGDRAWIGPGEIYIDQLAGHGSK